MLMKIDHWRRPWPTTSSRKVSVWWDAELVAADNFQYAILAALSIKRQGRNCHMDENFGQVELRA
jgi:hypothetical protein